MKTALLEGRRSGLLVAALIAAACAQKREFHRPERAANQREAGSVHVAVLAVAPWSHYESALQPQFRLDAEAARDLVVRDTASGLESSSRELGPALTHYFADRASAVQRDLNELFRIGRRSLAISVPILVACLLAAHFLTEQFDPRYKTLVEESFLILGWVANWRPLEIFLYDWWPLVRRRNLLRRLAKAEVRTKPYPAEEISSSSG